MDHVDPLRRLSPHFLLSDFLGNHSVYTRGYRNVLEGSADEIEKRLANAEALCNEILEPLTQTHGPVSVSYGYISPEVSRRVVTYQDPNKPSHHRWDLGAAADICVHDWVHGDNWPIADPSKNLDGAPVMLAHKIDRDGLPYSRMIAYSESPYLCVACSAAELAQNKPRRAFYENRYTGRAKEKPDYRTYASDAVRRREHSQILQLGLDHPWQGAGYPTYHGGGRQQYQHQRVSRFTMVSDWLFDLQSISKGVKNIPSLNLDSVQDAFGAAGLIYDWLIEASGAQRFSILSGYVSHVNPFFNPNNDWRAGRIAFRIMPPHAEFDSDALAQAIETLGIDSEGESDGSLWIAADVEHVYQLENLRRAPMR